MVVAFDNNVLCLFLHPEVDAPDDPATRRPVSRVQDRISYLVEQLRESRSRILIPTPVLAEFLTFATPDYLDVINSSAHFEGCAIRSARGNRGWQRDARNVQDQDGPCGRS